MQVINQKLSAIVPDYQDNISADYDVDQIKQHIGSIMQPIYTPLSVQYPVSIQDDKGNNIDKDDIIETMMKCFDNRMNLQAEKFMNELWSKTLANFKSGLNASSVFIAQANDIANAIPPSSNVIYTVDDVKMACKQFLTKHDEENLIVNTAFYITEPCLIFYFTSKFTFDDYKQYVKNMTASMTTVLSAETMQKFADFDNLTLDLVEGIILRNTESEGWEPYSFQRVITKATLSYMKQSNDAGLVPTYMDELLNPTCFVFLDVDQIAKASKVKLQKKFTDIKDGLSFKYKPISSKQISKLSTVANSRRRMASKFNMHQKLNSQIAGKRKVFRFKKVAMTKQDLSKRITEIVKKEVNVSASENYAKVIKSSYLRANRRNPDNFNLPGKSISLQYKPDIHVYLDTSGSISEDNYKNAILTLITMAKKLDVNIYFNSFSGVISKQVKLQIKGKSIQDIYREFQKVPKVTGGTEYMLVWDYIMKSPKRRKEISMMITDFEYYPPSRRIDYPKKLYYVPIDISKGSWNEIIENAEDFCQAMYHIDGNIRKKLLI